MFIYHEINKDKLEATLLNGLMLGNSSGKRDASITKADEFLKSMCPANLSANGIDRLANIYCYFATGDKIVDITSGEPKLPADILHGTDQALLRIKADASRCYVSDLDLYDTIKVARDNGDIKEARQLAPFYWKRVILLADYDGSFRRPEVMVTYNISPQDIQQVTG